MGEGGREKKEKNMTMSKERGTEKPRNNQGLENREHGCRRASNHLYSMIPL